MFTVDLIRINHNASQGLENLRRSLEIQHQITKHDFQNLFVLEIESHRNYLEKTSNEQITLEDAEIDWINRGYRDDFFNYWAPRINV